MFALSDKIIIAVLIAGVMLFILVYAGIIDNITAALIGVVVGVFLVIAVYKIVQVQFTKPTIGSDSLIGKRGKTITELNPEGMILVEGEYWSAVSEEPISQGIEVKILCTKGLKAVVGRVDETGSNYKCENS